jgi:hypothetical protein
VIPNLATKTQNVLRLWTKKNLPAIHPLTILLRFQLFSPPGINLQTKRTTIPAEEHPIRVATMAKPTASLSPSFVMVSCDMSGEVSNSETKKTNHIFLR